MDREDRVDRVSLKDCALIVLFNEHNVSVLNVVLHGYLHIDVLANHVRGFSRVLGFSSRLTRLLERPLKTRSLVV